jgi:protein arginine kinase activator
MKPLGKCFFCDETKHLPYTITEVNDGNVESHQMCKECGEEYMGSKKKKEIDLTYIKTPEELLAFIQEIRQPLIEPCKCGMTLKEFNTHGRFGCSECYSHFEIVMEQLVYPYHKARFHVGKHPKKQMEEEANKPSEKLKLLKVRYAKALELEEYEKLADLLKEIDDVKALLPTTSEDQ